MLWPDHCVQGSRGAEIESSVSSALQPWIGSDKGMIVRKGTFVDADAYSAFASQPDRIPDSSPFTIKIQDEGITQIFIVGIATDYCVRYSALDAAKAGFKTFVIRDAVRAVGGDVATQSVAHEFEAAGVKFISVDDSKVQARLE